MALTRMMFSAGAIMAALTGCVASSPKTKWHNSKFSAVMEERTLFIDNAECEAYAAQSIEVPVSRRPALLPTKETREYEISGKVNSYGVGRTSDRQTFKARITDRPRNNALSASRESFNMGASMGAAARASKERREAKNRHKRLVQACLMRRGWEKLPDKSKR